jgi:hypothetical protein
MADEFDATADPGIAIFYEGKIGPDRGFRFQTVVTRDGSTAEFSAVVDKLRLEADRQQAYTALDLVLSEIDKEYTAIASIEKDIKQISERNVREWIDRGKLGEPQLTDNEKGTLDNHHNTLVAKQTRIKDLMAHAEESRKKINGHATQ